MADMRRRGPEPPPGTPQIQHKPGLASEMLRELAPLLAEEGIDVHNIDVPDLETLQAAMNRAVERANMARFTPVGKAREHAVTTLRLVVEAVTEDDTTLAAVILESVPPELPDGPAAAIVTCDSPQQAAAYPEPFFTRSAPLVSLSDVLLGAILGRQHRCDITVHCSVGLAGSEVLLAHSLLRSGKKDPTAKVP